MDVEKRYDDFSGRFFFRPLLLQRQTQSRGMRIRAGIARLFAMSAAVRTTARQTNVAAASFAMDANGNPGPTVISRRPDGCPHAFCGCEASLYLFGAIRADLNLASNWARKFPHTSPAPGMAAVRNHHVMVLMSHVEGSNWLVHDGNSGGGLTREHVVSISGYMIVNPRGA